MTVVSVDTTVISISWTEPSSSNNISVYNLVLSDGQGNEITVSVGVGVDSYNFSELEEYRNYTCILTTTSIYGAVSIATIPVYARTLETGNSHT